MESEALRTLVLIVSIAVLSPFISDLAKRWTRIPGVVIEIALGMVIGPHVLGWAHLDEVIDVLAEMGLVFLIFLAGFEIDPDEVKGRPVRLAVQGWMVSLALGIVVAVALHALDVTSGIRFVAIALDHDRDRHPAAHPRRRRCAADQARCQLPRQRRDGRARTDRRHLGRAHQRHARPHDRGAARVRGDRAARRLARHSRRTAAHGRVHRAHAALERSARRAHLCAALPAARVDRRRVRARRAARCVRGRHGRPAVPGAALVGGRRRGGRARQRVRPSRGGAAPHRGARLRLLHPAVLRGERRAARPRRAVRADRAREGAAVPRALPGRARTPGVAVPGRSASPRRAGAGAAAGRRPAAARRHHHHRGGDGEHAQRQRRRARRRRPRLGGGVPAWSRWRCAAVRWA